MICVYFISHVPALLMLRHPGYAGPEREADVLPRARRAVERCAAVRVGQGARAAPVAPSISPNKTWEGLIGGSPDRDRHRRRALVGHAVLPGGGGADGPRADVMGFAGGLIMSAIKRDRGVKDYGTLIEGHGGMLDRIDSLCFAAPVFFHLTRYSYAA